MHDANYLSHFCFHIPEQALTCFLVHKEMISKSLIRSSRPRHNEEITKQNSTKVIQPKSLFMRKFALSSWHICTKTVLFYNLFWFLALSHWVLNAIHTKLIWRRGPVDLDAIHVQESVNYVSSWGYGKIPHYVHETWCEKLCAWNLVWEIYYYFFL